MTAQLPDLPSLASHNAEVRAILDSSIGGREAARRINELCGEGTTSEKSVRRYRSKPRATAGRMADPQPVSVRKPVSGSGGQWTPGIDIDLREGGEFRTIPQEPSGDDLTEDQLLEQFNLSGRDWEIVAARKSLWQSGDKWLEAHRVSFRPRSRPGLAPEDVESIFSKYATRTLPASPGLYPPSRIVMIPAGDLQLGKAEGGGTAATIERFCRITSDIADELARNANDQTLILPWLGDCIEGTVSQNARMLTTLDISVTEQVRAYRRLMMHQIAVLAPLCEKMIIPVVPGNHDETTRVQVMPLSDSWAIEGAMAVADWMDGRPEYEHVSFMFPDEGEPDITLTVLDGDGEPGPYTLAFIHGHTPGVAPGKIIDWWKGQSHGRQRAGRADMLVSAHFHHLRVENTGGGRTWLQIPALDGGSAWYRHRTGHEAPTGIVSVEIDGSDGQGWKGLTVHS